MARTKSKFVSSFGTAFEVFKGLADEVLDLGGDDDDLRRVLRDKQLRRAIAGLIVHKAVTVRPREFLHPAGEAVLSESTDSFNPSQYFQTRKGLYVWDGFKDRILSAAQPTDGFAETRLASFDLVKPANDAEIRSELPENHVFEDAGEFCAILAKMIDRQPNGGEGDLLSNGGWNIFYVHGVAGDVAVGVIRDASGWAWFVGAYPLDHCQWAEGVRAFSVTA
ncbi:MAG: hypothetical protein HYW00_00890 [Candidatus Colwellbacteria bacterium]|nr:hypothetical protein [Candidatus Colwellbacteria bacterium]